MTLIALYLLTTAKSCNDNEQWEQNREVAQAGAARDSIARVMEGDTLSAATLRAYEKMALNKLTDFGDYLKILRDPATAEPFKEQTRKMIRNMFVSGQAQFSISGNTRQKIVTLEQLLAPARADTQEIFAFSFDSARIGKPLEFAGKSAYSGTLRFFFSHPGYDQLSDSRPGLTQGTVGFSVAKRTKTFGNDSIVLWVVLLGE